MYLLFDNNSMTLKPEFWFSFLYAFDIFHCIFNTGLCSRSTWMPQATNSCLWVTVKSPFFILGTRYFMQSSVRFANVRRIATRASEFVYNIRLA